MRETLYKTTILCLIATLLVAVTACSAEEAVADNPVEDNSFAVTAEMAQQLHLRSYQETGRVNSGTYYMSYPLASNNSYNVAFVNFGKNTEISPEIGIVTVPENQSLKWIDVGGGSTPTFYLDNVNTDLAATEDPTKIVFTEDNNPYCAGLFDKKNGKNDLLWGSSLTTRNVKTVNFDLHHCMSRVKVEVTVDNTNVTEEGDLDLEGAKVYITNLIHKPVSYNRLDGSLALGETPNYDELELVNDDIGWDPIDTDTNDPIKKVYTTQDFVLPPQDLLEDDKRPHLFIKLKNGRIFSGILPHAMEIDDDDPTHTEPSKPVAFSFLKEHILKIRTVITEEPPELVFMPVWVVQWVDKGRFEIEAHQAGIYTSKDFYDLIKYYQDNNEYQLTRYGHLVTTDAGEIKWAFDIFHSIVLDYGQIYGKMKNANDQKDFYFNFNNYTNYIKKTGLENPEELKGPDQLYNIVTGKTEEP